MLNAIIFYLAFPFLLTLSYSPMWFLYRISDALYVIVYNWLHYREEVVFENLLRVFPDKTEQEHQLLASKYYRHLCDLMVETLKTYTWTERTVRKHVIFEDVHVMDRLFDQNKSVVLVLAHHGNWEWAGPGFSLSCRHQLHVIYRKLKNPYFDRLLVKARTKFDTHLIPKGDTENYMKRNQDTNCATAFIADQAPAQLAKASWVQFLGQRTAAHSGPEYFAKHFDQPVVFIDVFKPSRGKYVVRPILLEEYPIETKKDEISIKSNKMMEEAILKQPETWLWSHKRWKS